MADFATETMTVRRRQKESLVTLKACQPGVWIQRKHLKEAPANTGVQTNRIWENCQPATLQEIAEGGPNAGGETPELQSTAEGGKAHQGRAGMWPGTKASMDLKQE